LVAESAQTGLLGVASQAMNSETIKTGRIFPLYLAPIDWYFLCDDSPDYPMVFYVDLDFSGRIHRELMTDALGEALQRHPLLYSIVQPAKKNKPCWILAPEKSQTIAWGSQEQQFCTENEYLDIRETPGLRIRVRELDGMTQMTLQFHHACCDGTGAYRFVGDLIGCYMSRLSCCAGKVELGNVDLSQLKNRPTKMRSLRAGDNFLHKTIAAYGEAWRTFGNRIADLKSPTAHARTTDAPGMIKRDYSADQLANLRHVATSRGATFNDLLLCRMFQVAAEWNAGVTSNRKFRVMVPSDMRDGEDFEIPACNMTAYTFINRVASEIADEEKLLQLIRDDTLQIKNGTRQKSFMNGLTSAMATPFVLPMFLKRNVCLATSVLSNAGDPARRFTCRLPKHQGKVSCDEFTLEGITGVPPLRRMTRCTLSSSIYGRKLTFSMRCDPHSFSAKESGKLMDMFCARLMVDAN
jgi:NRPS condensation-like uncharacterized protein